MKPPPGGSNTVTTDSQVETSELVKRRDLPPYFLRSEYLVRKITVPIDLPTKPREKTTPQRSGLRERRRPESPQNKGPQISEVWTAEEHLEIWELKIFQEKLEKQIKDRQQEKINTPTTVGDRVQLVHITPRTTVVSTGATTPISSSNIIGVKVVGPGKSPAEIRATMEANLRAQRLAHQNNKKIMSVTTTSTNSPGTVVVSGGGIISGQGGTVVQTTIGGLGVRRIVAQAGQGQIAQVQTVRNTGPKQIIIRPAASNATVIASGSGTRMVSPTIGAVIRQGGVRPQVQILQGPNGQLTVRGLQPGQQLLKLPDGRLQLVNMNQQKPISLPSQSGQPVQKIMIQAAPTGQPGGTGQRFIQIRPALPVGTPTHLPTTTVRAVKIIQAAQPPGSSVVTAVSQAGSIIQAGSGQTVQVVQASSGQAMVLNTGTVLTTNAGQGSTTTTLVHPGGGHLPQKVVLSPLGQTPQLIVTNASASPGVVPIKTEIKKELLPNPTTTTPMAPRIIVASQPLGPKLVSNTIAPVQVVRSAPVAAIKSGASPQTIGATPTAAPAAAGGTTFVLAPAITQQIVKQKQAPQIVSQTVNTVAVKPEPPNEETLINSNTRQDQAKEPVDAAAPSVTLPVVQAPVTSNSSQVSQHVTGSVVPPVEKVEKRVQPAPTRKPKSRDPEIQRKFQRSKALVNRHADILRKSIMRKRALMEKKLALQIENEVQMEKQKLGLLKQAQPQQQQQQQPSKFATNSPSLATSNGTQFKTASVVTKKVQSHAPVKPTQPKPPAQQATKKRAASTANPAASAPCPSSSPAKKRSLAGATPSTEDSTVYCICKRRYDPTKFMIGCDLCENWFHIACIGVTEAEAQKMDGWVCLDCKQKKSDAAVELFCICRTPYDESQFYIYCDSCQGWFHGRCVGVLQTEANSIDVYICPDCRIKTGADEESLKLLNKPLTKIDLDNLKKLLLAVRNHKQAWPFKEPVNKKQAPDYYKVIKNPMDLRTVEQNLTASKYTTLQQFVNDMTLIFDNCRYFNPKQSNFYSCADLLEAFFVQKMKLYKEALKRRM